MSNQSLGTGRVFAIVGLSVGLITLMISFVPFIGVIAVVPGVFALSASITAVMLARRGKSPFTLSTIALAISFIGFIIAVLWAVIFYQATKKKDTPQQEKPRQSIERVYTPPSILQHGDCCSYY